MNKPQSFLPFMDVLMGLVGIVILINIVLALCVAEREKKTVVFRTDKGLIPVHVICDANKFSLGGVEYDVPSTSSNRRQLRQVMETAIQQAGEGGYILALVRPSGFETFNTLRRVVDDMKIRFGFEPINSDWEIEQ